MPDFLKALWLYPLPHHLLSRIVFKLTRLPFGHTRAIRWFIRQFDVDMNDALEPDPASYPTFNAFFTRELKPGARPIASHPQAFASPCDGTVSALGDIDSGRVFQAKGHDYSLRALLGGDALTSTRFSNGSFATLYLSPRDYHRLHMPFAGVLETDVHVPGRLYSVAPHTVNTIPGIFARNERVVAIFDTEAGAMALVLVGAINVAAIETVWRGLVTPKKGKLTGGKQLSTTSYQTDSTSDSVIRLGKGQEMGRFNMGSTIIVVTENRINWDAALATGSKIRMGEALGRIVSDQMNSTHR